MFGGRSSRSSRADRRGTPADFLVVGLGNPGTEFEGTRHNVGADAVTLVARRDGGVTLRVERNVPAAAAERHFGDLRVAVAIPTTYMNDSGVAVRSLMRRFGIDDPTSLVVVHDELDLPPGCVRIKCGGGLAGHKGLRSIESHIHATDFLRVRIGIGKPASSRSGADHVLRRPGGKERDIIAISVVESADAVEMIVTSGVQAAMNRFNGT